MNWLRNGIEDLRVLTDFSGRGLPNQAEYFCCLPAKYAYAFRSDVSVMVLIDEVVGISLETPRLTEEWQVRLRNLGEGWLPFLFHADWVSQAVPAPIVPEVVVPDMNREQPTPLDSTPHADSAKRVPKGGPTGAKPAAGKPRRPRKSTSAGTGRSGKSKASALSVTPNTGLFPEGPDQ